MSTTMLYKYPGPHDIHGDKFDYVIVDDEAIEQALSEGWSLTTAEAKEAAEPPAVVADVDDIEALRLQATGLGITVDKRWKEGRLREEIAKVR